MGCSQHSATSNANDSGVAAIKARLVILHFMELRAAPLPWRFVFEGWVVIFTGVILAGYWVGLGGAP